LLIEKQILKSVLSSFIRKEDDIYLTLEALREMWMERFGKNINFNILIPSFLPILFVKFQKLYIPLQSKIIIKMLTIMSALMFIVAAFNKRDTFVRV